MLGIDRSILTRKTSPSPTPALTFLGPDFNRTIYLRDAQGKKIRSFVICTSKYSRPHLHITRILPNGSQQVFSTATFSSVSSSITLCLNGEEIKLRNGWDNLSFNKVFTGPNGDLQWKSSTWGDALNLYDDKGSKLARYQYKRITAGGGPKLEIFVSADEAFVDLVLASAVAVLKLKQKEDKEEKLVGELVEGLVG